MRAAQHFLAERQGAVDVLHAELGVLREREHSDRENDPGEIEGGRGAVEAENVVDVGDHAERILPCVELNAQGAEIERIVGMHDGHERVREGDGGLELAATLRENGLLEVGRGQQRGLAALEKNGRVLQRLLDLLLHTRLAAGELERARELERETEEERVPLVEDERGIGEAVGRKQKLHFEGNTVDVLIGEGMRLREEQLVARAVQLEPALVLDRAEQFPGIAAVGNQLGHGGELAVDGGEQRLALRERNESTFTQ